jgi:hypothetical protein
VFARIVNRQGSGSFRREHALIHANTESSRHKEVQEIRGAIALNIHTHVARKIMAGALGLVILAPLPLSLGQPALRCDLAPVEGRVTYRGEPISNMIICIDAGGVHSAYGAVRQDGAFSLETNGFGSGAVPGTYRAHLYSLSPKSDGTSFPARFSAPQTSGLELEILPDWNYFDLDLR